MVKEGEGAQRIIENTVLPNERELAARYLRGSGIEIGALHNPLKLDKRFCKVRYVDKFTAPVLRERFPELKGFRIVHTDILCDVAKEHLCPLAANESLDFIIACHLLEHLPNPLGFLKDCHRVLRLSGILFLAVPDKDYTFDKDRMVTPLAHVVWDLKKNMTKIEEEHLIDWITYVAKAKIPDDQEQRKALFQRQRMWGIHVHVWRWGDVVELLKYLFFKENVAWELLEAYLPKGGRNEVILLLKKTNLPFDLAREYFEADLRTIVRREEALEGLLKSFDLLREEKLKLKAELEKIRRENEELRAELAKVYGSRAWRLVTVLRKIKHCLPFFRDL